MRVLILGGSQFLGRAIAIRAIEAGHDVTCATRGLSGQVPGQARFVRIDRDRPDGLAPLVGTEFDVAIDVSRHPGQVRRVVRDLDRWVGHWMFISTTSVYADMTSRGQRADLAPLLTPTPPEIEHSTVETYGAAKVACEALFDSKSFICRAGLIVGPGDPTGRFSYWVTRLKRGGEVLVPNDPDDPVQFVDVRDLAEWLVQVAQMRMTGCFDAIGPSYTRRRFLDACANALDATCDFTWVDQSFLRDLNIGSGSGPRSLPLPIPDDVGDASRDTSPALNAGLAPRSISETVRDTLLWLNAADGPIKGLTPQDEMAALNAWRRRC